MKPTTWQEWLAYFTIAYAVLGVLEWCWKDLRPAFIRGWRRGMDKHRARANDKP